MDEPTFDPVAVEPDDDAAKAFKAIEDVAAAGGSVREMEAAAHDALRTSPVARLLETQEQDHRATIAKLRTLANDEEQRTAEYVAVQDENSASYHLGFRDGLLRSISTIEGRDHSPSS